ncbi:Uncharacterised protein [Vibrio cholerae]|nr:Uncharacterised protein [Vibrio cholerae]CSB82713.1 Uncharacterised protein [Vibrio cholerae]CSC63675.1 Uncharacterised protein [Vibrio cholerae]CSC70143.1 Uncharacterised protein [Vibrio cholerae]CSC72959.1 Uncharacterised protein [Vibrio cholerae]
MCLGIATISDGGAGRAQFKARQGTDERRFLVGSQPLFASGELSQQLGSGQWNRDVTHQPSLAVESGPSPREWRGVDRDVNSGDARISGEYRTLFVAA